MDREIKFRAWDGREMRPVYGVDEHLLYFDAGPTRAKMCGADISIERMARADGVLMQFTGLKDRDGVEIYEGDLVEWQFDDGGVICEVRYGDARFYLSPLDIEYGTHHDFVIRGTFLYLVIGNIHQHASLLEE